MPRTRTQPRNPAFMDRFKAALASRGVTMQQAARTLGMSRQRLYTLLHWFPGVSQDNTERLAALAGVTPSDLTAWCGQPPTE